MNTEKIQMIWQNRDMSLWLVALRLIIGFEWLFAGIHKVPDFPQGMAGTLTFFASANPHAWMVNLITNSFLPNAELLGYFVMIGEILVGAFLILGLFTSFAALGSVFLNFVFFFAAGHLSESTFSVNWIMIALGFILMFSTGSKHLSLDQLIAHHLPWSNRILIDWFGFEKLKKE